MLPNVSIETTGVKEPKVKHLNLGSVRLTYTQRRRVELRRVGVLHVIGKERKKLFKLCFDTKSLFIKMEIFS